MAGMGFKITPTSQFASQLMAGVNRAGSRMWASRVLANAASISTEIGNMLADKFNKSAVAQSLRGQGQHDLPAHFGLDDSTANALADGMAKLIRSSVRLVTQDTKTKVSVRIKAVEKDWDKYLSLPGAQYISGPSNITIPVAKWLLIDPNIDIGQAAYDIVFIGEKFDAQIQTASRSGRAIMISLKELGGGGGYVLPSIVSGRAGKNFIEYALGQKGIVQKAARILMKKV